MNQLQVSALLLQGMISSRYVADFTKDGRSGTNKSISKYEATAIEAVRYAKALIKENKNESK